MGPFGRQVLDAIRPNLWLVIALQFLSLLASPLALLTPLPLKIAIDQVLSGEPIPDTISLLIPPVARETEVLLIAWTASLVLLIALCTQAQEFAQSVLSAYTVQKLRVSLRSKLFEHAQKLCITYHDSVGISDSIYKISNDANSLGNLAAWGITPLLSSILLLISIFIVMIRLDSVLASVAIVIAPVLFWLSYHFGDETRKKWKRVQQVDHDSLSVIHEALSNLRIVKSFNQERRFSKKFGQESKRNITERVRFAVQHGYFSSLTGLTLATGSALVMYIGIQHVKSQIITLGTFVLIMSYLSQLYSPLRTLSHSLVSLQTSLAELERCNSLLLKEPRIKEHPSAVSLGRVRGEISFDKVSFGYQESRSILSNISFSIPAGRSLGIFGETGAGKTTILALAARLFDPTAGRILIDGIDLRKIKLDELRRQYSIVLQEPTLFSGTIAENIAVGRPSAGMDEIVGAAQSAYADNFIANLPNGYETNVGERGMSLSGGQRQRIALARAFLKDSPILLLDEPTSAVDVASERIIMKGLSDLMVGRTTFMIAHRLTTLEKCDYYLHVTSKGASMVESNSLMVQYGEN